MGENVCDAIFEKKAGRYFEFWNPFRRALHAQHLMVEISCIPSRTEDLQA
jgi:hypothetical protein